MRKPAVYDTDPVVAALRRRRQLLKLSLRVVAERIGVTTRYLLTDDSVWNAIVCHAAVGGSTNLVLHIPAFAHAAGLRVPTVEDMNDGSCCSGHGCGCD